MVGQLRWWQQEVIYQLIVRSFRDSNGDGEGDLPGLIEKLDYLQWLGVGAVWLTPIYPSPMADCGYDVASFTDVDPRFGTLADFDRLLAEAHRRSIRVLLDWVPNHTSDQHPWFLESRSSRQSPKRDWYFWRDRKPDGSPPNNWVSIFGGSTWEWDEKTGQVYLHTFLKEQPDVNWRNPEVRAAMFDTLRFWLDRGVDGFRVDATDLLIKDEQLRDNPANPGYDPERDGPDRTLLATYTRDQPYLHDLLADVRQLVEGYGDRLVAGELYLPPERVVAYYGQGRPELHLPFNLEPAWTDWDSDAMTEAITRYELLVPEGCWPTWTIGTHDCQRVTARVGMNGEARLAAMLLLTLRGTPTLYYGDEIGMHHTEIPPEKQKDPQGKRIGRSRDPARTPMQWDDSPHAGFSTAEPWLPVSPAYPEVNVKALSRPGSLLDLYRQLLQLRRQEPLLVSGSFIPMPRAAPLIVYQREQDGKRFLVVLNLGAEPVSYGFGAGESGRILLSTRLDRKGEEAHDAVELRGHEGVILSR